MNYILPCVIVCNDYPYIKKWDKNQWCKSYLEFCKMQCSTVLNFKIKVEKAEVGMCNFC